MQGIERVHSVEPPRVVLANDQEIQHELCSDIEDTVSAADHWYPTWLDGRTGRRALLSAVPTVFETDADMVAATSTRVVVPLEMPVSNNVSSSTGSPSMSHPPEAQFGYSSVGGMDAETVSQLRSFAMNLQSGQVGWSTLQASSVTSSPQPTGVGQSAPAPPYFRAQETWHMLQERHQLLAGPGARPSSGSKINQSRRAGIDDSEHDGIGHC